MPPCSTQSARRRKTRLRLFAGMATRSTKSKPWLVGERAHVADVAHAPLRVARPEARIECRVARRGVAAVLLERPVEIEHAVGGEQPRGAGHQPLRRRPRRNVDHVDRHDGVGMRHRPGRRGHVEFDRRAQVGRVRGRAMGRDARQRLGIDVGRLPDEVREVRSAKYAACSPVPLAISSTVPCAGRTRRSTARIGSRLRATAGDSWAAGKAGDLMGRPWERCRSAGTMPALY